ncbi:MAG: methylenetetrahydrofolate--tRNA-(uracil(54)-C(5))-methyltransferase (FADH(2)-oxidizing) TrmFO [Syntrophorhabdus sp.]
MDITVVGGGLAGVEAAYQLASRGHSVSLFEMRPTRYTPAHKTPLLSELVCSNSLKSKELTNAHGLLKEELRILGSIVINTADQAAIPGGKALVVDREIFAKRITREIEANPLITVIRREIQDIPAGTVIIASGPLTSNALAKRLAEITGVNNLFFFDAISPIIDGGTVDMDKAFFGSRYDERSDDYLNCSMTGEEYDAFYNALIGAEKVDLQPFEKTSFFEGCLPVEIMAQRGRQTLAYGPMKPVGLKDKTTGKEPYAVLQLRRENMAGTMYNMVGFQTKLTYAEQDRVFRMIPALRNAVFLRYGSIHRNTYINSPALLNNSLCLKGQDQTFFAGQITGVEGYVESVAMGLVAGISAHVSIMNQVFSPPPEDTCVGALLNYITTPNDNFQPMNINFGLIKNYRKRAKEKVIHNALQAISLWNEEIDEISKK